MPINLRGRYEPGSDKERAHRILKESEIEVDQVYGIDVHPSGMEEITFTFNGTARTAFVENEHVAHVTDGWDVMPPKPAGGGWRRGY